MAVPVVDASDSVMSFRLLMRSRPPMSRFTVSRSLRGKPRHHWVSAEENPFDLSLLPRDIAKSSTLLRKQLEEEARSLSAKLRGSKEDRGCRPAGRSNDRRPEGVTCSSPRPQPPQDAVNQEIRRRTANLKEDGTYQVSVCDEEAFTHDKSYKDIVRSIKDGVSLANVTQDNQHDLLKKTMTPLHHLPYEEQLQLKTRKNEEFVLDVMKKCGLVS